MRKSNLFGSIILAATAVNASALEIDAALSSGYDSNPFKLTDRLDPDGGWFAGTKIKATQKIGDFRLRGSIDGRAFEGNLNEADNSTLKLEGRYLKNYTLLSKKATSYVKLQYTNKDKTYVKRSTGEVATSSGQKIKDRYDYKNWKGVLKTSVNLTGSIKTGIELSHLERSYDDPNIASLSNLDYDQSELTNSWQFDQNKQSTLQLSLNIAQRVYDNKREKTLLGSSIAGTDLEYDYYSVSVAHKYKFSSNLKTKLALEYKERRDSGTGYYDTDEYKVSARIKYKIQKGLKLTAKALYHDLSYVNDLSADEDDENLPGKDGYTLTIQIDKKLKAIKSLPINLFANIKYDDYDSNDTIYSYDRVQLFAGIEIAFDSTN
ncbi:hypothetical protein ACFL3U_04710 [Pseudomonadota bacterium]